MRYSKHIYMNSSNTIDAEIKPLTQTDVRNRLRTGHIVHSIIGDLLAVSLHEFLQIEDRQRLEALLDTLQHHAKMQQRMTGQQQNKPQPEPEPEPDKQKPKPNRKFGAMPGV